LTTHTQKKARNSVSGMESLGNKRYVMPTDAKANSKTYSDFSKALMNNVGED